MWKKIIMFQSSHELLIFSKYTNVKQKTTWRIPFAHQINGLSWNIDSFHRSNFFLTHHLQLLNAKEKKNLKKKKTVEITLQTSII